MRRNITTFALLLSLPCAVAARGTILQTGASRLEQTAPNRSPSPSPPPASTPASLATPEPERKSADLPPSVSRLPSLKDGQNQVEVVRANTTLVTVPVTVQDRNGRYITDLQKEDFHIDEAGIEQEIVYFATIEKPFTVVLMLDTSASNWSKLPQIRAAAKVFIEQLRPDDRVMVVSFARGLTVECKLTGDRQRIRKAIDGTGKGFSTHLYDAMNKLMQKHLNRIQGRQAVVLFTDGVDATSIDASYESTVRAAEELDALIYPIRYDTYDPENDTGDPTKPPSRSRVPSFLRKLPLPLPTIVSGSAGSSKAEYTRGERYLHEVADLTGGRVYEASKDLSYLADAFSHIAEELRRQYSVGYYPKQTAQAGERRRLKIRVSRPDLAVRTRDSYIYKGNTGAPSMTSGPDKRSSSPPALQKKPSFGEP